MLEAIINNDSIQACPWLESWPVDELESVSVCPVCGGFERDILHEGLIDNAFLVAPGTWTLHRCCRCNSAYLDPRPSPASIGKAYGTYYTHTGGSGQTESAKLGVFRLLRRMLANGYLNHRYGVKREPASSLGAWMVKCVPGQRSVLDMQYRYLPKPTPSQCLLDIGCGNGDFLVNARVAGWQVSGVEPDLKAVNVARQRGINVTVGTIDVLDGQSHCFDAITLSHVIEHVHEPRQLLQAIHRLLKPGGIVYIDTPNIESHGAQLFKKNWRGIETPRHLVLFNPNSLEQLLLASGFDEIKIERRADVQQGMYLSSARLAALCSQSDSEPVGLGWLSKVRMNAMFVETNHLEYITLTARKKES